VINKNLLSINIFVLFISHQATRCEIDERAKVTHFAQLWKKNGDSEGSQGA
jgi:hypothetical protein